MLNDNDGKKVFVDLAKLAQESFFNRRQYEWKIAFGLWTSIGLWTSAALAKSEKLDLMSCHVMVIYVAIALTWLFFWLVPNWRASEQDKLWKHYYMNKAEGEASQQPKNVSYWDVISPRGVYLVTAILGISPSRIKTGTLRGKWNGGGGW